MYENLPPRGSIIPNLFPAEEGRGKEVVRGVESSKVTSVSQCESDRGTHGRGTPPIREEGQPRLDELFRQLQLKQVCLHVCYGCIPQELSKYIFEFHHKSASTL